MGKDMKNAYEGNRRTADPAARHTSNSMLIRRFWPYEKKYWKIILIDLTCALLTCLCDLILPLILRYITNTAVSDLAALTVGVILKLALQLGGDARKVIADNLRNDEADDAGVLPHHDACREIRRVIQLVRN